MPCQPAAGALILAVCRERPSWYRFIVVSTSSATILVVNGAQVYCLSGFSLASLALRGGRVSGQLSRGAGSAKTDMPEKAIRRRIMRLKDVLERNIKQGSLHVFLPDGTQYRFGAGAPEANWHIKDSAATRRIAVDPEFELGETYLEGGWSAGGSEGLRRLLAVLMCNFSDVRPRGFAFLRELLQKALRRGNEIARSYQNVEHHYDLDEWLFRRFLDKDMFYSCAYFEYPEQSLEDAQQAKCRLIMRKLLLKPGQRVLDIGSGWGGLAFFLASHADVEVVGLTLSREQLRVAQSAAEARKLQSRVKFILQDYREHQGEYDRIVSVGMFEHVGLRHYPEFFDRVYRWLKPDGVALLHTIGGTRRDGLTNPWIRRHIFPGGHTPLLSQLTPAVEKSGLMTTDAEILRLHYAYTLCEWYRRFQSHRPEVVDRMGERFARMWEFYLAICEAGFRWWDSAVFQLQLAKRHGVVPITKDYLFEEQGSVEKAGQ